MKVKIGDTVKHGKGYGRVTATSGTDGEAIIRYDSGTISKWLKQEELKIVRKPKEGKDGPDGQGEAPGGRN